MIMSKNKSLKLIPPISPSLNVARDLRLEVVERSHIIDVLRKNLLARQRRKGCRQTHGA